MRLIKYERAICYSEPMFNEMKAASLDKIFAVGRTMIVFAAGCTGIFVFLFGQAAALEGAIAGAILGLLIGARETDFKKSRVEEKLDKTVIYMIASAIGLAAILSAAFGQDAALWGAGLGALIGLFLGVRSVPS